MMTLENKKIDDRLIRKGASHKNLTVRLTDLLGTTSSSVAGR